MISWQFSQATKSTVNVEPVAWLTVGVSFLKFLLESYCKICKLWSWSGLALAKASAFVRTAAGTRRTSKAPLFLAPTLFVPDDPAFSDAASTSSAIPTHKDTSTVLPPPVDGQGESRRSSQLDIPDIDTIDIMINTAFCNFIPMTSIPARAFSLLHFTFFCFKHAVSFLRRKRQ